MKCDCLMEEIAIEVVVMVIIVMEDEVMEEVNHEGDT